MSREVDERLEKFSTYFVELFESYFSEYHSRLIQRSPNCGRFVQLSEETIGSAKSGAEVLEGTPKALALIFLDLIVMGFKMERFRDNWQKLKELAPILLKYAEGNLLRDALIEGAGLIFAHFEAQFMNVMPDAGWEYVIRKIATDAVNRVISHLREVGLGTDDKAVVKVISEGLILGKSKRYWSPWGTPHFHLGHTVTLRVDDETTSSVRTPVMFKNLGTKTKDASNPGQDKYYKQLDTKSRKISSDRGVWFRLAFDWESTENDPSQQLCDGPQEKYTYTYKLNGRMPEDKLESIKQIIEEGRSDGITKGLDEIKSNAEENAKKTMKILNEYNEAILNTLNDLKIEIESLKKMSAETHKIAVKTFSATNEIKGMLLEARDRKLSELEKPIRFNVDPPVPSFIGRKEELTTLHKLVIREPKSYLTLITVIYGLGGIGKTQIARAYIREQGANFFHIVWLNAATAGSLNGSFVKLAADCKIPTADINGETMAMPAIVKKVYNHLRERKSSKDTLVIFDNAEESDDFGNFLPAFDTSKIAGESRGEIRILITSRQWEWAIRYPDIKKLSLRGFNRDDAINFVYNSLKDEQSGNKGIMNDPESKEESKENNPEEATSLETISQNLEHRKKEEIEELVDALQRFPLALEQAVAYIIDKVVTDKDYSVSNYLEEYKRNTEKLLDNEAFKNFCKQYDNTTFATWNLTMAKILTLGSCGKLAIRIINIMAFIAPDDIRREIFFRLEDVEEDDVKEAVRLLVKYSMVNAERGQEVLNVHRLVQEVIRLQLQKKDNSENHEHYRNGAMALFHSWCGYNEFALLKTEEISRVYKFILPHVDALVVHWTVKNKKDTEDLEKLWELLFWLVSGTFFTHDLHRLEDFLLKSIEICRILKGEESSATAEHLQHLADVYMELGKYSEAVGTHKQALAIYTKLGDQTLMAEIHSKIADIYSAASNIWKSKEHYYAALRILDKHVKGNDPHVVMNKLSICLSLRLVDDSEATTNLLKENIRYWEQYTGEMKYLLSPNQILELGEAYTRIGNKEKGKEYFSKSLKMCETYIDAGLFYSRMMRLINDTNLRGNLRLDLEAPLEKSLTIIKETQGPQHIETVKFMLNFSNFHFMMGNYENGFQLMKEALDIARRNNYVLSEMLVILGFRYNQTGDYEKALELTNEGLSILKTYHGESSVELLAALEVLAMIYGNLGDTQQQRYTYKRLLRIIQEQKKDDYKCEQEDDYRRACEQDCEEDDYRLACEQDCEEDDYRLACEQEQECEDDYRLAWAYVKYGQALKHSKNHGVPTEEKQDSSDAKESSALIKKGMKILIRHFGTEEQAEVAVGQILAPIPFSLTR